MSIGPWFKCYPSNWLEGVRDLSLPAQGAYSHLLMRMYDAADAIPDDAKRIGRWLNSNAAGWRKVRKELIEEGKLTVLSDGRLINRRALIEMHEQSQGNKKVPQNIRERIAKLLDMFPETFAKHIEKLSESSPENALETRPLIEARSQKPDTTHTARAKKIDAMDLRRRCFEAAGLTEADAMTTPGLVSTIQIQNLIQPASGEPCDLERDVLPAIQVCAARLKAKNSKLTTWGYCHAVIIENRDRRLAGAPAVQPAQQSGGRVQPSHGGARPDSFERLKAKLAQTGSGSAAEQRVDYGSGKGVIIDAEPVAASW